MHDDVSTIRRYALRAVYALNFVGLGVMVWPAILNHQGPWDPFYGVAYSFWAALSLLMSVGIRYPLKMLPMLFIQLVYKSIWLLAVMLPMRSAGLSIALTNDMLMGLIVDLIVIPWPYVFANYVRAAGDRWKPAPEAALSRSAS